MYTSYKTITKTNLEISQNVTIACLNRGNNTGDKYDDKTVNLTIIPIVVPTNVTFRKAKVGKA